jgi:hypothetical protein
VGNLIFAVGHLLVVLVVGWISSRGRDGGMTAISKDDRSAFELERLKFIYGQIGDLNQNVHRLSTVFHTLTTAILGGGVSLVVSWKKLGIDTQTAQIGVRGLLLLFALVATFVFVSLVITVASWYDFRQEETALMNRVVGAGSRTPPRLKNF